MFWDIGMLMICFYILSGISLFVAKTGEPQRMNNATDVKISPKALASVAQWSKCQTAT